MGELTNARHGELARENARQNLAWIPQGRSLADLRGHNVGADDSAIVIAAGPSIKRNDPAASIHAAGYNGAIVATDSAIAYCLRSGIVPDLIVTLDPHPTRIVRWFGDPDLNEQQLREDDYFARQDHDTAYADQLRANDDILNMLARHGRDMRIALSTSASEKVVRRAFEVGMEVFWWNPMLDDPDQPESVTAALQRENGLPCVNAGGNVGTACWVMAEIALNKTEIALTGMDFSYYPDTPYWNTQYYHEAVALFGEEYLDSFFIRQRNPHLDITFYADPAYYWYRQCFLEMAREAACTTFNCTEGGILFGDPVHFRPLDTFLTRRAQAA